MCSGSSIIYLSWASCASHIIIIIVVVVVAFALDALVVASLKYWYRSLTLCIRKIVYCRSLLYPLALLVQGVYLGKGCVLTYYTVVHPTPDCTSLASDVTTTPRLSSSDDCSRGERTTSPFPNYSFRFFFLNAWNGLFSIFFWNPSLERSVIILLHSWRRQLTWSVGSLCLICQNGAEKVIKIWI